MQRPWSSASSASAVDRLAAALERDGFFSAGAVEVWRRWRSSATAVDRVARAGDDVRGGGSVYGRRRFRLWQARGVLGVSYARVIKSDGSSYNILLF
jgi:hypothetical protein